MTELEELRAEIAKLREEITALKARPETHYHYHGAQPSLLPQPVMPQYWPGYPYVTSGSPLPQRRYAVMGAALDQPGHNTVLASGDGETRFA